jgi:hypothetical protein
MTNKEVWKKPILVEVRSTIDGDRPGWDIAASPSAEDGSGMDWSDRPKNDERYRQLSQMDKDHPIKDLR